MKALNRIDKAHFKRLTETLNVENVRFTGLNEKFAGVYNIHCERSYLSVRAVGQMVPVHVPLRPPEPLSLGELVSLVTCIGGARIIQPQDEGGRKDDKSCYAEAQQPGAEARRLDVESLKALQLWTMGSPARAAVAPGVDVDLRFETLIKDELAKSMLLSRE
eukprot:3596363-Amphidinium_carterae.1